MSVPSSFECPITGEPFKDPVIDPDGHTYEKAAILDWLSRRGTSPITRKPLTPEDLRPNRALRDLMAASGSGAGAGMAPTTTTTTATPPPPPTTTTTTTASASSSSHGLTLKAFKSGTDAQLELAVPEPASGSRPPMALVLCLDTSSSMRASAILKTEEGKAGEDTGLTVMDLVKHASKVIVEMAQPGDFIGIVSFSDVASVDMPMKPMNTLNKATAKSVIEGLHAHSTTNIWGALDKGLELLRRVPDGATPAMFLLTDGAPNVRPPRGEPAMLTRALERAKGPAAVTAVHTFGFGYATDTKLLVDIAQAGRGVYSFIPDVSFVGTVFIHALANLGTVGAHHISVTMNDTVVAEDNAVRFGRARHVAVPLLPGATSVTVKFYVGSRGPFTVTAPVESTGSTIGMAELGRQRFVTLLGRLVEDAELEARGGSSVGSYHANLKALVDQAKEAARVGGSGGDKAAAAARLEDATGQVTLALSRFDWYRNWGRAYLRSFLAAHAGEYCSNFKDASVQAYATGDLFETLRDAGDTVFCAMPAPKPAPAPARASYRGTGSSAWSTTATAKPARTNATRQRIASRGMATFHSRSNACVASTSPMPMADGSTKLAGDIRAGDVVTASMVDGTDSIPATVEAIMVTDVDNEPMYACGKAGAILTAYHPFLNTATNAWAFPCESMSKTGGAVKALQPGPVTLISFVLKPVAGSESEAEAEARPAAVRVADQWIATLGHGVTRDTQASVGGVATVLEHAYWGTEAVVKDIIAASDASGRAFAVPYSVVKDTTTGLAVGLSFFPVA